MAVGSGLGSPEEESTKKHYLLYRIQDRLHGRLVHDEDSCHYFDAAIEHKNVSDEFLSTLYLLSLIVPCMYS